MSAFMHRIKERWWALPRRRRIATMVAGTLLGLYALLGFLLAPMVARPLIEDLLNEKLNYPSHIGAISFNPFTLRLQVDDLLVGGPEDAVISWDKLDLNLSWSTLWHGAVQIEYLRLEQPQITGGLDRQGKPILLGVIEALKERPLTPEETEATDNDAAEVDVTQPLAGAAEAESEPAVAVRAEVEPAEVAAPAEADSDAVVAAAPSELQAQDAAPAQVSGGADESDTTAENAVVEEEETGLFPVDLARLELIEGRVIFVDLRPVSPYRAEAEAISLSLNDISTRPDRRGQLELVVRFAAGAELHWRGDLQLDPIQAEGHLALRQFPLPPLQSYLAGSLNGQLASGVLSLETDYRIQYGDAFELNLAALALDLEQFELKTASGKRSLVSLPSVRLEGGELALEEQQITLAALTLDQPKIALAFDHQGQVDLASLWRSRTAAADSVDAEPARPWNWRVEAIKINQGAVSATDLSRPPARWPLSAIDLALGPIASTGGAVPLRFSAELDEARLGLEGSFALAPLSANLKLSSEALDLTALNPYLAPVVKLQLGSGQFGSELDLSWTAAEGAEASGQLWVQQLKTETEQGQALLGWRRMQLNGLEFSQPQAQFKLAELLLEGPEADLRIDRKGQLNFADLAKPSATAQAESKPAAGSGAPAYSVEIKRVRIQDGQLAFADRRLAHPFATQIGQLQGEIAPLSSAPGNRAQIDLQGRMDRYAPIKISGYLMPFAPSADTKLSVRLRQLPLTSFSPYSQQYAAHSIEKGRMDLDLGYRIKSNKMRGDNRLLIDQLRFGPKVESPDAVDVPVGLALMLLKDTSGQIHIDLPVKGDLSHPDFSYGSVLWGALRNVLLKAVSSPFTALSGVFKSGQQPDLIVFAAADSALSEESKAQLEQLAKALAERPEFALELSGLATAADWQALARQKLLHQARKAYNRDAWFKVDRDEEMSESQYFEGLDKAYPGRYDGDQTLEQLEQQLVDDLEYDELSMQNLAKARAQQVRAYLVETAKLAEQRLFMLAPQLDPKASDEPGVRLKLSAQ